MPNKVNAAVSQLAGEIADRLFDEDWLLATEEGLPDVAAIISAALSEREQKISKLIEAAKVSELWLVNCIPTYDIPGPKPAPMLRAALSALGE